MGLRFRKALGGSLRWFTGERSVILSVTRNLFGRFRFTKTTTAARPRRLFPTEALPSLSSEPTQSRPVHLR